MGSNLLGLLTKQQLAEELGLPLEGVQALTRQKKISVIRLGHRTVRYRLEQVRVDLQRLEIKADGRTSRSDGSNIPPVAGNQECGPHGECSKKHVTSLGKGDGAR